MRATRRFTLPLLRRSYVYRGVPHSPGSAWDDVPYSLTITVLHFKWHAAVLRNMQDRVKFYKGAWQGRAAGLVQGPCPYLGESCSGKTRLVA